MRVIVTLVCDEEGCKGGTYHSTKNKKNTTERLRIKKFCKKCRKHTVHVEKK
jgi:large subunit ribosomal protein L33